LVIFRELTSGDVEIMMVMDWEPGALVKFKDFMQWAQEMIGGGDPDSDVNLPPEFALMRDTTPQIEFGALEGYEGCYSMALGAKAAGVNFISNVGTDGGLTVFACEAGDYLLLASSEYGMNELLGQYELKQQNITAGSFLEDPVYKQTYKALWDGTTSVPDVLIGAKFHQLMDNLIGQINALETPNLGKAGIHLGAFGQYLPMMSEDVEVFTAGFGVTLDSSSEVRVTLQVNDEASLDNPIYTLGKQASAANGEIEGYYDTRVRFGVDMSSPMIDSIDMAYYMSADELGTPMDGYNLVAMMLQTIEEMILDAYIATLNQ
jgi:hypothetical protein